MKLMAMKATLWLSVFCVLFIMGGVAVWMYNTYPMKAADVWSYRVITPSALPGGTIIAETRYSKYLPIPGLAIKEAVAVGEGGGVYLLFSEVTNVPPGSNKINLRSFNLPAHIQPGRYWIDSTWQWPLPGWRDPQLIAKRSENTFEVLEVGGKR